MGKFEINAVMNAYFEIDTYSSATQGYVDQVIIKAIQLASHNIVVNYQTSQMLYSVVMYTAIFKGTPYAELPVSFTMLTASQLFKINK